MWQRQEVLLSVSPIRNHSTGREYESKSNVEPHVTVYSAFQGHSFYYKDFVWLKSLNYEQQLIHEILSLMILNYYIELFVNLYSITE